MIRRRPVEAGLFSRRPPKKLFKSSKNKKTRLEFKKANLDWSDQKSRTVLFSVESKLNFKDLDGIRRVSRPNGQRLNSKYFKGTVIYGGGIIMVWGFFPGQAIEPIHKTDGIMDRFMYRDT